uniref:Uncharacterized protein n=1 Tax=Escherichia coli TaxID=562 RepID=A0A7U1E1Z4_ECOLX|nr:hypothetical protein [Escherichia coli]
MLLKLLKLRILMLQQCLPLLISPEIRKPQVTDLLSLSGALRSHITRCSIAICSVKHYMLYHSTSR